MPNAIILVSGGFDSVATAYYVKEKIKPEKMMFLFFDYGQRCKKEEEYCMKKIAEKLNASFKIINLDWLGKISTALINKPDSEIQETKEEDIKDVEKEKKEILNWWIPCRNSIFIIIGLAHAESEFISKNERYDVYIGLKNEGKVPMKDTTPGFVQKINELAEQGTHHGGYKVIAPLIEYDKDQIVKIGEELNVPWEFTYSCYDSGGFKEDKPVHCGICPNCKQRQAAFYWANIKDPSVYLKKSES